MDLNVIESELEKCSWPTKNILRIWKEVKQAEERKKKIMNAFQEFYKIVSITKHEGKLSCLIRYIFTQVYIDRFYSRDSRLSCSVSSFPVVLSFFLLLPICPENAAGVYEG